MKIQIGLFLSLVLLATSACSPTARDLELKRLSQMVETMQAQLVVQDHRLENLTNKMTVLKQTRQSAVDFSPPSLKVVRLTPSDIASEPAEQEEKPIVLTLHGTKPAEVLPIVAVPKAPIFTAPVVMANPAERALFVQALEHHGAGRLEQAGVSFEKLVAEFPSSKHVASAHFWLGECHFESHRPQVAVAHYERVFSDYPNHTKAAGALLKTGLSYKNMKRIEDAQATFSMLLSRYPRSAEAELARVHLSAIQGGGS